MNIKSAVLAAALIALISALFFLKPVIDNVFKEEVYSLAIKTCGSKEKVKSYSKEGFECKQSSH